MHGRVCGPAGWQSIKLENLYGGRINTATVPETAGDYGFGIITGSVSLTDLIL